VVPGGDGARKGDAADFREAVQAVVDLPLMRTWNRDHWGRFLYHHTTVRNAISMFRSGRLLSRNACDEAGIDRDESANIGIIDQSPWAHDYARLYFRPKTPTHFHVEGIRPPESRHPSGAHCGSMVMLLFDAVEVLSLEGTVFTAEGFARKVPTYSSAAEYRALPHEDIFSAGYLPSDPAEKDRVKKARSAEVLVPNGIRMDVPYLRAVICRSGAERETLVQGLSQAGVGVWYDLARRVRVERRGWNLFHHQWIYARDVRYDAGTVLISLHAADELPAGAVLDYHLEVEGLDSGAREVASGRAPYTDHWTSRLGWTDQAVHVRFWICESLAYDAVVRDHRLVV